MSDKQAWSPRELPLPFDLESRAILKILPAAHAALAGLKELASSIPDQNILINTLGLQEAKDSSAVENIITTHDDLYKSGLNLSSFKSPEAKEVQNYIAAMKQGHRLLGETGILSNKVILEVQKTLEQNNAGFRKLPGTHLRSSVTGEVIFTPPQDPAAIESLMSNLERYINEPGLDLSDPLVKMAVIHFQFESIHPFYDGNGRTGRILSVLFLAKQGILDLPILYLSKYIIRHKHEYYRLLQDVRDNDSWEPWILFIIKGLEETTRETISLVREIRDLLGEYKLLLRSRYKFYSHSLINNLFRHPYTKIEFIQEDLQVSRITAANYLNTLANDGILKKEKQGTANYYINTRLFDLLTER